MEQRRAARTGRIGRVAAQAMRRLGEPGGALAATALLFGLLTPAGHAFAGCVNTMTGVCDPGAIGPHHLPLLPAFAAAAVLWLFGIGVVIRKSGRERDSIGDLLRSDHAGIDAG